MQSGIYVGLSAQIALEKRLETIANNVANSGTAGSIMAFRLERWRICRASSHGSGNSTSVVTIAKISSLPGIRQYQRVPRLGNDEAIISSL